MTLRAIFAALALPVILISAGSPAIRGFDAAGLQAETQWEQQARAIPTADRVRATIEKLSSQPHLAGTPGSKQTAEWLLAQLREYGLDANIEVFESMLPTPEVRVLEMTAPTVFHAKLEEPPVAADPTSSNPGIIPSYNAFSGDGDVTAQLVYANYGVPADYDTLKEKGIDVKGKIVIVRYGGSFRGVKPRVAYEHGAVGCLIYSDPRDDGYFQGDAFPKGPFRPADGVQRGSVIDLGVEPGDPLSPGWASEPGSKRLTLAEATTIQQIPVLPISYGDAQPLLAALDGPVAPEAWRGALPVTYHLSAGAATVHLKVTMDNSTHPLYDVIAKIPGAQFPDEWVMAGNHHDAWVFGASDPLSGAAPLLETARTLAELTRKGWKPRRTIVLAFWDGEEFGLIGSTEYMEKHADELNRKLAVYINSDSSGKGTFSAGGSPALESLVKEAARDVKDPVSGKSILDAAVEKRAKAAGGAGEFHLAPLGSGSDFTPFLQHLGIASLDLGFSGESGNGIYHSAYDDFYWYSHFEDTEFVYGRTLAQVNATLAMRLADAPVLPFEFDRLTASVNVYLDEIDRLGQNSKDPKDKVNLDAVRKANAKLKQASDEFDKARDHAGSKISAASPEKLAAINRLLIGSERDLAPEPGLPGRDWYRHRIYAPGRYTGYAVKTLPGIREAVEAKKTAEAAEQAQQVANVLQALADHLSQAAKLIGKL
jgi:N-acetylated-alpha-linked acidic dipeptidase